MMWVILCIPFDALIRYWLSVIIQIATQNEKDLRELKESVNKLNDLFTLFVGPSSLPMPRELAQRLATVSRYVMFIMHGAFMTEFANLKGTWWCGFADQTRSDPRKIPEGNWCCWQCAICCRHIAPDQIFNWQAHGTFLSWLYTDNCLTYVHLVGCIRHQGGDNSLGKIFLSYLILHAFNWHFRTFSSIVGICVCSLKLSFLTYC